MKFGILFGNTGYGATAAGAAEIAEAGEDLGYESVWTIDHVVVPADYQSAYPYSSSGKMRFAEDEALPDPIVWLTWVAARTTTLRLATGVLVLPQRHPAVLAKQLATLDNFSGGRVTLGVGIGWLREELAALGIPFEERAARTEEAVAVMRALWADGAATFDGRFIHLQRAQMHPKPAQAGGVPIVIGGDSEAAARRAGRIGDGFFPVRGEPEGLAELFALARRSAEEAGRDPDALELTAAGRPNLDTVEQVAEIGLDRFLLPVAAEEPGQYREQLGRFSESVMAKLGSVPAP